MRNDPETLPPYHLVQILRSRMYHEIELNKAYSWPLGLKIGRNRRILWTSKLELEQHNVTLPYSRIPDSAITKGIQTLNPHSLTNHEIDGGKEIRKGWRGHLQGDDVPDDEAVVYGDGEEARVGGEAAWARLLVRLRELHPLLPLTRGRPPGDGERKWVLSLAGGLSLRRGGVWTLEGSHWGFEFLVGVEM